MSRSNKRIQFQNYLIKWGLSRFRFFAAYPLYVFDIDYMSANPRIVSCYTNEIVSVDTLIKWAGKSTCIYLYCDSSNSNHRMEFNSFDELKQYALIRKLSMI